jgi:hypothetical protein
MATCRNMRAKRRPTPTGGRPNMELTSATVGQRAYRNDWRTRQTRGGSAPTASAVRGRAVPDAVVHHRHPGRVPLAATQARANKRDPCCNARHGPCSNRYKPNRRSSMPTYENPSHRFNVERTHEAFAAVEFMWQRVMVEHAIHTAADALLPGRPAHGRQRPHVRHRPQGRRHVRDLARVPAVARAGTLAWPRPVRVPGERTLRLPDATDGRERGGPTRHASRRST